ncbi:MAG: DNA-3-methyladenine glycosylase [Ornithinimicrobium sp.]|uniref:DNA-3-methyladenine glycosylase n=1 Tax=Ornithinimicrobium sp. TaxID=1977084 RepID=UPI0026E0A629|nr:DNA-3-methyladenine glycosylase [Ornithinimicrobium sp.]MDO5739545.1 DNA-3-methyladenine glycosylase [Ornithinimicrobium sp.]
MTEHPPSKRSGPSDVSRPRLVTPDREFFGRSALAVAPELLGAHLRLGPVTVRLTEVEAYAGTHDPGSHAFRGPTPRTQVMFGPAGHLYVYFSYGMHWCCNIVCGSQGEASAVLLRAGEVVQGQEEARTRRDAARARPARPHELARGPACLTSALDLGRQHDGLDLFPPAGRSPVGIQVLTTPSRVVKTGPRVGVSGEGGDAERYPWRFWLPGEPTVSVYRPAASRRHPRATSD